MERYADVTDDRTADECASFTGDVDAGPHPEADIENSVLFDAIVVRYESDSDRCTLVPRDGEPVDQLRAWLTADLDAVVDLDDAR